MCSAWPDLLVLPRPSALIMGFGASEVVVVGGGGTPGDGEEVDEEKMNGMTKCCLQYPLRPTARTRAPFPFGLT